MNDMMTFPETWEEYEKQYGFTDNEEVYTNGSRLIPSFRVRQWLDHLPSAEPERKKGKWIVCGDKHVCSECDEFALCDAYDVLETGEYQEELSNFCPNCGADMRGEKEETE